MEFNIIVRIVSIFYIDSNIFSHLLVEKISCYLSSPIDLHNHDMGPSILSSPHFFNRAGANMYSANNII